MVLFSLATTESRVIGLIIAKVVYSESALGGGIVFSLSILSNLLSFILETFFKMA